MKNSFLKSCIKITGNIGKVSKLYIPILAITTIAKTTVPYVLIYYSAKIIDSLSYYSDYQVTLNYIYTMVVISFILTLIPACLETYVFSKKVCISFDYKALIAHKAMTMDYQQLEKEENLNLLNSALEGTSTSGGIYAFLDGLFSIITDIISLFYASFMISGLFFVNNSLEFSFYNSIFPGIIIILSIAINVILSTLSNKKINKIQYQFFQDIVITNRHFGYYLNLARNCEFGKEIRNYKMQDLLLEHAKTENNKSAKLLRRNINTVATWLALTSILSSSLLFITYLLIGGKAYYQIVSIGTMTLTIAAVTRLTSSFKNILSNIALTQVRIKYLDNFLKFYNLSSVLYQGQRDVEDLLKEPLTIEFKNVYFSYPNSNQATLENISFTINSKQKVAVVGKNGAGKSTIVKLLTRLYDPNQGQILINGIDIKDFNYQEYKKLFSVVFQDFKLFPYSIASNISCGKSFQDDKINECLKQLGALEFVNQLPLGINTPLYKIDDQGIELSGGQSQKISIARALYKDSPIVILDEPTAALDPLAEAQIYSNFNHLVAGKSSLFISHRMSSCKFCDLIIVIDESKVVEMGNHNQLLEKDGIYAKMWNSQAQYYQEEGVK